MAMPCQGSAVLKYTWFGGPNCLASKNDMTLCFLGTARWPMPCQGIAGSPEDSSGKADVTPFDYPFLLYQYGSSYDCIIFGHLVGIL